MRRHHPERPSIDLSDGRCNGVDHAGHAADLVRDGILVLVCPPKKRKAARWSQHASDGRQQKRVLTKSIAIIAAYFFTWTPNMIALIPAAQDLGYELVNTIGMSNRRAVRFGCFDALYLLTISAVAVILPLQGFFDALIFSGCAEHCLGRLCFGKRNSIEARSSVGGEGTSSFSVPVGAAPATSTD